MGFTVINPNLVIQVIVLYGPVPNSFLSTHNSMESLLDQAYSDARKFKGPTIIAGDINCDVTSLQAWTKLQNDGFWDAALEFATMNGFIPQPTCRDATRFMYLLVSRHLRPFLEWCDCLEDFYFSDHPVLKASFRISPGSLQTTQLFYPKSFDDAFFDSDLIASCQEGILDQRKQEIHNSIESENLDLAVKSWSQACEQLFQSTAVDATGLLSCKGKAFLGRGSHRHTKTSTMSVPFCKPGRQGDFQPKVGIVSTSN